MQADKTREFLRLRLQILRCHRDLKVDKLISRLPSTSWQRSWHLYCEIGTKGSMLELRHPGCVEGFGGEGVSPLRLSSGRDQIIEIREGSWSYVAGSIGKAPEKVVGMAKPKEETKERRSSWLFSTGDELTIHWESTSSMPNPDFMLTSQSSDSSVRAKLSIFLVIGISM
ncbi:hypothetical protein Ancab_000696 [Ancistrocladus abbreviatus]